MRTITPTSDVPTPTRAGLCDAMEWLVHDRFVPVIVKDRQHAGAGRTRHRRPVRPGRSTRPRSRRTARSSARSGDSGDDDPGEPEPHPAGGAA